MKKHAMTERNSLREGMEERERRRRKGWKKREVLLAEVDD